MSTAARVVQARFQSHSLTAMKRIPSARAPSPANTMYSGISNYRTDQYKPLGERSRGSTSSTLVDPKVTAKVHYDEMASHLENHLAREPANARASAREKLTRLTRQQFQELSTDVYDELLRRKNNMENEVPFLPVRDDFHPKRNQARQKLATLPKTRFKDLSGDVFYELGRRYPEFKEPEALPDDQISPNSNYDDNDIPSPDFPQSLKNNMRPSQAESSYGGSTRRPSEDIGYRRPSEDSYRRRPSEDMYGGYNNQMGQSDESPYSGGRRTNEDANSRREVYSTSSRRKPSQDIVTQLRGEDRRRVSPETTLSGRASGDGDRDLARRPSGSVSTASDSTNATNTQREMIIPNKSTIAEEDIEVPYGRERESSSTAIGGRASRSPRNRERDSEQLGDTDGDGATDNEPGGMRSLGESDAPAGGLNGLSARLLRDRTTEDEDDEGAWSGQNRSGEEYFDKLSLGRASVASDRSTRISGSMNTGRMSKQGGTMDADIESIRREYEYKVATMQNRITGLERSVEEAQEKERRLESGGNERVREVEEMLKASQKDIEERDAAIGSLSRDLAALREERLQEQREAANRTRADKEEVDKLRERCRLLEMENATQSAGADTEVLEQLRSDLESLLSELADLSHRNDDLMIAKDSDLAVIHNLDSQLKEYKRKYEMAKTELRSFKATSQLFLQSPKPNADQLPMSPDGGLLDIHVTTFISWTDSLLSTARSNAPSKVLSPTKAIVNAVTAILDDVRMYERQRELRESEADNLRSMRERTEATLSNLVAAAKTHATSMGLSPVSLLDAASSHLSAAVTDLGRTIYIRKANKIEQDQFLVASGSLSPSLNGFPPAIRSIDEIKLSSAHQRAGSASSFRTNDSPSSLLAKLAETLPIPQAGSNERRVVSPLSSTGSSPPPLFEQSKSRNTSDDNTGPEGSDDAWAELKPYLEAQSESIVIAIQNVLSGVRSATPSPSMNEDLTQIITIVSSIVAVCKDSLPPACAINGENILRELSEHANKLSEVQNLREVTKESRQIMAKSSFAIANAMKGLMKL